MCHTPCILLRWIAFLFHPSKETHFCLFYKDSPLLSTRSLLVHACCHLVAHPVGSATTLENGQVIYNKDVPLTIKGICTLKDIGQVWVVLRNSYKDFYLQNPPVEFLDNGEWIAENIRPGKGITAVMFVRVSKGGNRAFQQKVDNNEWGGFDLRM
jgi:hypothetical protein